MRVDPHSEEESSVIFKDHSNTQEQLVLPQDFVITKNCIITNCAQLYLSDEYSQPFSLPLWKKNQWDPKE